MNELMQQVWERLLPRVLERLGARAYRSWIEPLSVQRIHAGVVHLEAKSRWIAERTQSSHGSLLSRLFSEELGTTVEVEVHAIERQPPTPVRPRPSPPAEGPQQLIVDDSNRVAFRILECFASGKVDCNPVVLFGLPGVGKTALARSFIRKCVVPVRSYTATEFLREFAGAVRRRQLSAFRDSFDESRGLVLDEVHRLKGKKRGQAEFVRLLARLVELGRPVLMASRHHPHDIQALQPSLASRLLSGFVVEVFPPKWEARMQCLRNLEAAAGKRLPEAVLTRIADCYRGGYSGLKEAWKRLWERLPERAGLASARLQDEVMSVLGQRDDPLLDLVEKVAGFFGVSPEELMERGQARRLSTPRQLVQYLAVRRGLSAAEVGRRFDGKTRASVSYSCKELMKKIEQDPNLARLVEELS